ncbi:MAG: hypothetical protein AAF666_18380 [Pseudomonadota bacterium]
MSWLGNFTLGAASGVSASLMAAVAIVFVVENGTDDFTAVFASTGTDVAADDGPSWSDQLLGQLSFGSRGQELEITQGPVIHEGAYEKLRQAGLVGLLADPEGDGLSPDQMNKVTTIMNRVLPEGALAALTGEMASMQVREGETPEQAIDRALGRFNPEMLAAAMTQGGNPGMLGLIQKQACDPALGEGKTARQRALWEMECANMARAAEGRFPFGINDMDDTDLDLMAAMNGITREEMEAQCNGPAPEGMIEVRRLLREKVCSQVRSVTSAPADGTPAAPQEAPAAEEKSQFASLMNGLSGLLPTTSSDPAEQEQEAFDEDAALKTAEAAIAAAEAGDPEIPRIVRKMKPELLVKRCHEPLPEDMPAPMKTMTQDLCARVFRK